MTYLKINKNAFYLIAIFTITSLLYVFAIPVDRVNADWEQVPIRSINQKKAGMIGGEGMQMIQSIAYAPTNPKVVYMVSDTSQVWKSIDAGKSWRMKHKGFSANGGLSVVVDPINENIAFVAGSIGTPLSRNPSMDSYGGIFRTTDGGESWKLVKQTLYLKLDDGENGGKYFAFEKAASDTNRTKTIYAGTYNNGLLESKDGGDTWVVCGLAGSNIYDIKLNPKDSSIVFVATVQGLYKYDSKSGKTTKIGGGLPDYPRTIAVNVQNPSTIYATVGKYGVYWSVDGGMNFSARRNGLPVDTDCVHIAISPVNPNYLYVSFNKSSKLNPFWSNDAGNTWHTPATLDKGKLSLIGEDRYFSCQIEPHPVYPDISLTSANGKARVLITGDGGQNWSYSGEGYTGGRMGVGKTSLAFSNDPVKMIFFLIDHGPAITLDNGDTFKLLGVPRLSATTTPVGAISPKSDSNLIVTAVGTWNSQELVVSIDNGISWSVIDGTQDNYKFIAFHPQKPNIIYAQGFISRDNGNSWDRLSQKISAVFRANGEIVYSVTSSGTGKSMIIRSNDAGKTWAKSYPELPIDSSKINEIDIDPSNPDRIYVASNAGLFIYNGTNWLTIGENNGLSKDWFGFLSVKCVAVDPRNPAVVYVGKVAPGKGQSNGIYRSVNYGQTWLNITGNLGPEFTAWSLSVSPHDGTVYVGSSHGTWKLPPPYNSSPPASTYLRVQ
jgi:photosystem II stability/assembly factor-like uncharacterized protein